jgi:hypothetical protein
MDQLSLSWLRNSARVSLLYIAVGVAFAPFGLVYALLAVNGWDHWISTVLLLGCGFVAAQLVWNALEKRVNPMDAVCDATLSGPGCLFVVRRANEEVSSKIVQYYLHGASILNVVTSYPKVFLSHNSLSIPTENAIFSPDKPAVLRAIERKDETSDQTFLGGSPKIGILSKVSSSRIQQGVSP